MSAVVTIAVVGAGRAGRRQEELAEAAGRAVAQAGATLVCGGLGGVMAAACRGARTAGGVTVGILPGTDRREANPWVDVAIPTGLGELRNGLVVRAADAVVAIGGGYGTLSEIALALKAEKVVMALDSWSIDGVEVATDPGAAVTTAINRARARGRP